MRAIFETSNQYQLLLNQQASGLRQQDGAGGHPR